MNTVYMTVEIQLPYPIEYNIIQIYSSNGKKGVIFIYRFLVSLFKKTILHCIKKNLVASLKIWGYIGEPDHFFITSEFKKKISILFQIIYSHTSINKHKENTQYKHYRTNNRINNLDFQWLRQLLTLVRWCFVWMFYIFTSFINLSPGYWK